MIETVSAVEPKAIVRGNGWMRVWIDVLDNNTLFVGYSKQDLLSTANGLLGGTPVDKTHPLREWFDGELWWIGSVNGMTVNIVIWPSGAKSV